MKYQVGDERAKLTLADASPEVGDMAREALPPIGSVPWSPADLCPLGAPLRDHVRRGGPFRQPSAGAQSGVGALPGAIWGRAGFRKNRLPATSLGTDKATAGLNIS